MHSQAPGPPGGPDPGRCRRKALGLDPSRRRASRIETAFGYSLENSVRALFKMTHSPHLTLISGVGVSC